MSMIGFIGCGNMGGAIARAVCKAVRPEDVLLSNRTAAKAVALAGELGCKVGSNEDAAECDWVFLAVKPQMMPEVLSGLCAQLAARKSRFVLVTMAAGLSMARIRALAGGDYPVVRMMPNTPAAIGKGMIQYCCADLTDVEKNTFASMLAPAGLLDELAEGQIDAASCVSGCGPAWAYQFIEALADGGVAAGLPRDKAIRYAAQMLAGSAELVLQSGSHPGVLKDAVCSPGGSTIQGVRVLEQRAFRGAVTDAVLAAYDKTIAMGQTK